MRGAFALSPEYCSGFISLSANMHISLTGSSQVSCPPSVGNLFKQTACVDEIQNRISFCCSRILSIALVFIYRQKLQRTRWSEREMAEESRPVNFSYATGEKKKTLNLTSSGPIFSWSPAAQCLTVFLSEDIVLRITESCTVSLQLIVKYTEKNWITMSHFIFI